MVEDGAPGRRRGRLRRARARSATRDLALDFAAARPPGAGRGARRPSTPSAARRCRARGSTSSPASARCSQLGAAATRPSTRRSSAGFTPDDHADAGQARVDGGHRVPRRARGRGLPAARPTTCTWSAPARCRWRGTTRTRSSTCRPARSGTPAGRPASGARPARTARTPAGIIRVHQFDKVEMFTLLPTRGGRRRAPAPARRGRRRCWPRSSCRTG